MTQPTWEDAPVLFAMGWIGIFFMIIVVVWWAYTAIKRKELFEQSWMIIKYFSICIGLLALMFCAMMFFFSTFIMIGSFFLGHR